MNRSLRLARIAVVSLVAVAPVAGCATGGTGLGLDLVPDQQVRDAGLQAWQHIRSQTPATSDAAQQQRAERVAARVLKAAGEDPAGWEVVVFRSPEVNAFALPGNKIGLYEGMMKLADADDQLAAVIGHEIAHDEAKHAAQRMNTEAATQVGVGLLGSAVGAATGADPHLVSGVLGAGAEYGVILPYSRNQELEADRLGLRYMAEAGFDPHAAIALWQKMRLATGGGSPTFLSTHPATEDRIEQLQAQMPEAEAAYRHRR